MYSLDFATKYRSPCSVYRIVLEIDIFQVEISLTDDGLLTEYSIRPRNVHGNVHGNVSCSSVETRTRGRVECQLGVLARGRSIRFVSPLATAPTAHAREHRRLRTLTGSAHACGSHRSANLLSAASTAAAG